MEKVVIGVHKNEKKEVLEALQETGVLHIKKIKEEESIKKEEMKDKVILNSIKKCIDYLKKYLPQGGFLDAFLPQKVEINEEKYRKVVEDKRLLKEVEEVNKLGRKLEECEKEMSTLKSEEELLLPWEKLEDELSTLKESVYTECLTGIIENFPPKWEEITKEITMDYTIVHKKQTRVWILLVYLKEEQAKVKKILNEVGFEQVGLSKFEGKVEKELERIRTKKKELNKRREETIQQSQKYLEKFTSFLTLYDHYSNLIRQREIENLTLETGKTICIEGWIRSKDFHKLKLCLEKFTSTSISKVKPSQNEIPPVDLANPRGWHIFEVVTELYSSPQHKELDPSPFLAPFFVIFFALCLTDAFYGLLFVVMGLMLLRKIKEDKRLMWVLIVSGLITIPIGAITGGWFGDFPTRFEVGPLIKLKQRLIIFDPMEEPLTFFMLALGLGFLQVLFGYLLGFINEIKQGNWTIGVTGKLSWIVFWVSLMVGGKYVRKGLTTGGGISSLFTPLNPYFGEIVISFGLVFLCIFLILFFSGGRSRNFIFRVAKGGFNLYQGLVGTVGDIISYSRLMALGLVTMGLATSINILAEVMSGMKYIKWVIVPLLFIGGHIFSMGINVLGAYVHTLRLQYAEFFTKFFEGGGKKFTPFRKEGKYVVVNKKTIY